MLRVARKNVLELKLSPTTTTLPRKVSTASVSDVDVESSKIDASRRLQCARPLVRLSVCHRPRELAGILVRLPTAAE